MGPVKTLGPQLRFYIVRRRPHGSDVAYLGRLKKLIKLLKRYQFREGELLWVKLGVVELCGLAFFEGLGRAEELLARLENWEGFFSLLGRLFGRRF